MKILQYVATFVFLSMLATCIACVSGRSDVPAQLRRDRESTVMVQILIEEDDGQRHVFFGSGTIVGQKEDYSLVLTAGHMCEGKDGRKTPPEFYVIDRHSSAHLATPVTGLVDDTDDLCMILASGKIGSIAPLGSGPPEEMELVSFSGAPGGAWDDWTIPFAEGRYLGEDKGNTVFSTPTVPGASGAGVFYEGKLFSVITAYSPKFSSYGFGSRSRQTIAFVNDALRLFYGN